MLCDLPLWQNKMHNSIREARGAAQYGLDGRLQQRPASGPVVPAPYKVCAIHTVYIYIRYMVDGKRPAGDSLMSGGRRTEPVKDRSGRPPSTRHTAVSEHFLRRPKHNYTRPTDGTPNEWMRWPQTADHARLLAHRPTILLYKSPK